MKTFIEVEKRDLDFIGHTHYDEGGKLAIVSSNKTSYIEEILLRSILKCFGEQYKIVDTYDYDDNNILYVTNLPYLKINEF